MGFRVSHCGSKLDFGFVMMNRFFFSFFNFYKWIEISSLSPMFSVVVVGNNLSNGKVVLHLETKVGFMGRLIKLEYAEVVTRRGIWHICRRF